MITFEAKTKQEKWIKFHFESKANLMRVCGMSRPTVDRICKDKNFFYKYLTLFAKKSGCSIEEIVSDIK